jgi:hypothetical protein
MSWAAKSRIANKSSYMDQVTSKIYVRFIDGVEVYIPVEARLISDDVYQLMPDHEFDYDDDATLFEFGSHDIVRTKEAQWENGTLGRVAYALVEAGDPRNLQKRLLTQILLQEPEPQAIFNGLDRNDIELLLQKIEGASFMYPTIKNWWVGNKGKIQSMM